MTRCALCPAVNACIPPDGPQTKGGLLFIGEAPGGQEDRNAKSHPPGEPFIGKTGEEVNRHYLPLSGLRREAVCMTNAIACLPDRAGGKLDPTRVQDMDLLRTCAEHHLYPLIAQMQPRILIPLGQFACRAVFGESFDLELKHGLPQESPFGIPTFPMFHPALGLHEPKKMLYVRTDWDRLRKFLKGSLYVPVDAYPEPDYAEVETVEEIEALDPTLPMGADTESSPAVGPYCLTYSQAPGTGRLIAVEREDLLDAFQAKLDTWESDILFHNWMYDWMEVEQMRLVFPIRHIVDTMVRVYHLGNLPQGLKALSHRELGMTMQDFDDLVTPYSTAEVLRYYRLAYAETWEKPEPQTVRDPSGKWKLYKPHSMSTKLKTFFTNLQKNPEKDVFGAWDNWQPEHAEIERRLGPWPGKDIRHVPREKLIVYACRDADALIRLHPLLVRMAAMVRRYSQEIWLDQARARIA